MRAEKAGAAGDQNSFRHREISFPCVRLQPTRAQSLTRANVWR
jgi:hypothetical protein